MSKKAALIFNWTLTFLVIAVLAFALVKFSSKYTKFTAIGKKQLNLFAAYQEAESALFYIDLSARYALQQSVYEMGRNGAAVPQAAGCGNFYGYQVWNQKSQNGGPSKNCFDTANQKDGIIKLFNISFIRYTANYPLNISSDYSYQLKEGIEITAKSSKPINFEIMG